MFDYPMRQKYIDYICENRHTYYRLAYSFMGNEADSMDAVSQLTLIVLEKGHSLRQPDSFPAWSKKVLANICRSRLKERGRREMPLELPLNLLKEESGGLGSEETMVLRQAVRHLPEVQRDVIILRYYLNYEYKEIAALLDVPQGTVKSRLHRAIAQLQEVLRQGADAEATQKAGKEGAK